MEVLSTCLCTDVGVAFTAGAGVGCATEFVDARGDCACWYLGSGTSVGRGHWCFGLKGVQLLDRIRCGWGRRKSGIPQEELRGGTKASILSFVARGSENILAGSLR